MINHNGKTGLLMRNILWVIVSILLVPASSSWAEGENLLPGTEFKSSNGITPDSWTVSQPNPAENIFKVTNQEKTNVLEVNENSQSMVNSIFCRLSVDGFKSFKVKADFKHEDISKKIVIIYYWLNQDGKFIDGEKYVYYGKAGSSDWTAVEKIIAPDNPVATKGIMLCIGVYGKPDGNGKAMFRNVSMTVADKQEKKSSSAAVVSKQPPVLKEYSFRDNFTAKPKGQPYYISRGNVGFLDFCASTFYAAPVKVNIKVPQSVETALYMLYAPEKLCMLIPPEKITVKADEKIISYNISEKYHWLYWSNGLFFKTNDSTPEKFNTEIEFQTANGEFKVSIPVEVLEKDIPVILPRNFPCYAFYSFPLSRISPLNTAGNELPDGLYQKWVSSGFVGGWGNIPGHPDWKPFWEFHSIFPFRVADSDPRHRKFLTPAQTVSGDASTLICPSVLIAKGAPFFIECLKNRGMEEKVKAENALCSIDYEPYVDGWTTAMCFCPECIKKFAAYAGLNQALTPQKILTQYEKQWVKFRCVQNSLVVKAMADAIHQVNPKAKFTLCSMPQAARGEEEDYLKRYGIDLTLYESFVDIHMPMIYNTDMLFYQRLQSCLDNLKNPVMPTLSSGWGAAAPYNPQRYKLHLLASAMLGSSGAMIYSGVFQMDDAYFKSQREIMQRIAKIEDNYLVNGRIDRNTAVVIPQFMAKDNLFSVIRASNGKYLVFLCNNNEKDKIFAKVKLNVTEGEFQVKDLNSSALIKTDKNRNYVTAAELKDGISVAMSPLDYMLLEITPGLSTTDAQGPEIMASDVAVMNEKKTAQFNSKLKLHQENGFKAGTIEKDGKLFYLIENSLNKLTVSLENSAVAEWQVMQNNSFSTVVKEAGIDMFVFPDMYWVKDVKAEFKDFKIKGDTAETTFFYSISKAPFDGLLVEKTYYVHKSSPELKIKVVIIPAKGYRQFAYRANTILGLSGNAENICYQIPDGKEIKVEKYAGRASSALDLLKSNRTPFLKIYAKKNGSFDGTWCVALNTSNNNAVKATFDDRVDELFFWRDGTCATMEWVYSKPYQDNDPHKAAPWEANYSLKYIPADKKGDVK